MPILLPPFCFEHNRVHPGLHIGSRPQPNTDLGEEGFDVVVFCAQEHQPSADAYPPLTVLNVPLWEDCFTDEDAQRADEAGLAVARLVKDGKRVIVTCMYGRNRSGLVTGLALHHLLGWWGTACLDRVRRMRANSLHNHRMNTYLLSKDKKEPLA